MLILSFFFASGFQTKIGWLGMVTCELWLLIHYPLDFSTVCCVCVDFLHQQPFSLAIFANEIVWSLIYWLFFLSHVFYSQDVIRKLYVKPHNHSLFYVHFPTFLDWTMPTKSTHTLNYLDVFLFLFWPSST